MRILKFMSLTAAYSRREAEILIEEKKVTINGRLAEMGSKVGIDDQVKVNDQILNKNEEFVYIALNKPIGIVCTTEKIENNIIDFVGHTQRIFPIGRIDKDSEGLILLTNDGDIVNKILNSENNNEKEYIVTLNKPITNRFVLTQMAGGVKILDTITKPCLVNKISEDTIQVILTQGLNRQIRRMCETLGYEVISLKRIRIMNIELGDLEKGKWRELTKEEILHLKNSNLSL